MGFGTLFAGYFLILNFTYYRFTDAIAGVIMLYALYKLSSVNKYFRYASIAAAALTLFGVGEFGVAIFDMLFSIESSAALNTYLALIRHFLIAATTLLMLLGMRDVSREVGLRSLRVRCNYLAYVTLGVYTANIILETSGLDAWIPTALLGPLAAITLLATLALIVANLYCIFSCYSKICMPEDNSLNDTEKKSRFGFINDFREHTAEKQREYAEYKLSKIKKKAEKQKQKNKKNDEK